MRTRLKRGFTLIELLVVMFILVLLVAILLPAVLRGKITVIKMQTRGTVKAISDACNEYIAYYGAVPGIIPEPPDSPSGTTPAKISGSQSLRLCLLGASRSSGGAIAPEYQGPIRKDFDISDYSKSQQAGSIVARNQVFYTPKEGELKTHPQLSADGVLNTAAPGYGDYDSEIEVLVDRQFQPPRPFLYYRKTSSNNWKVEENEVYCLPDKGETALPSWSKGESFIITSAGEDRRYFSPDDLTLLPQ